MSAPFIFIATNRLRPGALEAERRRVPGLAAFVEEQEPRVLAFNEYVDPERRRAQAGAGVPMVSFAEHLGGFTRRS